MLWPRRAKFTPGTAPEQTRTNYENKTRKSTVRCEEKCICHMPDPNRCSLHQDSDNVEAVILQRAPMPVNPDLRRPRELPLLPPAHGLHRTTETVATSSFNFDESHRPIPLCHQVYVPMAVPEPPLHDPPAFAAKPPLSHTFANLAEFLAHV